MCKRYWPDDTQPVHYGDLKVVVLSETKSTDWVVTTIEVSMVSTQPHTLICPKSVCVIYKVHYQITICAVICFRV